MPRQGKARNGLASIKDITRTLELREEEGRHFKTLVLDFLLKKKKLKHNDIIATADNTFRDLAREFLESESSAGKGPTANQYWPIDDTFERTLTYAANPSYIVTLVSHIMLNHKKNLLDARKRRSRKERQRTQNRELEDQPGPSTAAGIGLEIDLEPGEEERAVLVDTSSESSDLESVTKILRTAQGGRAAVQSSDPTNPSSHLATPPVTPAVSMSVQRHRTFHDDSPHPSIETQNTTAAESETLTPPRTLQSPTAHRDRRRKKSPSAFPEYNPRLPTHHDGTLDTARVKAWRDGVEFAKGRLNKFNWGLVKARQTHLLSGDHDTAMALEQQTLGLGNFLDYLESEERKQEKRVKEFTASRMALAGAARERGTTRTLSPSGP